LRQRATALRATRAFLDARGYIEIEAPLLVANPGLEPQLDAFEVPTGGPRRYLHTSPEYALKRVLGDGLERVYALGPCFRDEPSSRTHSPEFTMLEWYQAGLTLSGLMDETEALVGAVLEPADLHEVRSASPTEPVASATSENARRRERSADGVRMRGRQGVTSRALQQRHEEHPCAHRQSHHVRAVRARLAPCSSALAPSQ
jgi:lysyl-tRNA synthetase class 2